MSLAITITICSVVVTFATPFILERWLPARQRDSWAFRGYVVGGRSVPSLVLIASLVATYVGGGLVLTLITIGFDAGLAGVYLGVGYLFGFILTGLMSAKIRNVAAACRAVTNQEAVTILDVWDLKYTRSGPASGAGPASKNRPSVALAIMGFVPIIVFFIFLAAQVLAFRQILGVFFPGHVFAQYLTFAVSMVLLIIYTAWKGMPAVIWTDVVQVIFILVLSVLAVWLPISAGPPPAVWLAKIPLTTLTGLSKGYGLVFVVGAFVFIGPSLIVRFEAWQRAIAAKGTRPAATAFYVSGIGMLYFFVTFAVAGMFVRATGAAASSVDAPRILFTEIVSNPWARGFALAGFVAVVLSSADTLLNVLALAIVKLFSIKSARNVLAVRVEEGSQRPLRHDLRVLIGITGIVGLAATGIAFAIPHIVTLMIAGTASLLILAPATLASMYAHTRSPLGALLSVTIGFAIILLLSVLLPKLGWANTSFVPAVVFSLVAYYVGYGIDKARKSLVSDPG